MVNERVTITTKFPLTEKETLLAALEVLQDSDRSFFYEETSTGFKVRNSQGEATLEWDGNQYAVKAANKFQGTKVVEPVVTMYQGMVIQNTYIEAGFMTERVQQENNTVQVNVWRL
jgi:hypothetical protein